jgi:hypothetical protein
MNEEDDERREGEEVEDFVRTDIVPLSPGTQVFLCFLWTWIGIFLGTVTIGAAFDSWEAIGNTIGVLMGIAALIAIILLVRKHPWKALGIFIALAAPFLLALVCSVGLS